jgi:hypothetical protein
MLQFYIATLHNLRSKWPNAWPGLPVVLNACIYRLWPQASPVSHSQAGQLIQAARNMASHMEAVARASSYEPHYHNRLHTADALTAVCLLMLSIKEQAFVLSEEWAAALLLAVTSHDVLHPGGANAFVQEFEQRSAHEMRGIAQGLTIESVWTDRVSELILRTDPTLVAANHDRVKDTPFEMNLDWACVLMNEADILASATSRYGPELGQALAQEWALKNHPLHEVVGSSQGRLQFLSSLRFSTPASKAWGMQNHVERQLITSLRS